MLPFHFLILHFLVFNEVNSFDFFGFSNGYRFLKYDISRQAYSDSIEVETKWIKQPLDHFDADERRHWSMRYFQRLDLFKSGGPIYIFLGGEGEAHPGFLKYGLANEMATETNGALFMTEHRYYGQSIPIEDKALENLRYLSSKQALADVAQFVKMLKRQPMYQDSKVVAIGGSYPGNLAAWFKLIYPDLVDAALASSAPVLAKKNFYEYLETVSDDYEQYGTPGCFDFIKQQFESYDKAFKTKKGRDKLKKEEKICESSDLTLPENQQLFVYGKSGSFMIQAQYGDENSIRRHCERIMKNKSKYSDTSEVFELFYNVSKVSLWNRQEECYDLDFYDVIDEIKENDYWLTPWVYQMCTEFSYAKSTSSENQPFSKYIPIETFYKICSLSFGPEFNEESIETAVNETNLYYGGLTPNVKNVIFSNGELDPWHRLAVLEDVSYDAPSVFIPRSSHCRDLYSNRKGDPDELVESRKYIKYLLKSWIGIEPCGKYDGDCLV